MKKNNTIKTKVQDKMQSISKIDSLPKTVQDSIPYTHIFDGGIIETRKGHFTKSYPIQDVNFQIAREEQQLEIFSKFMTFLNSFSKDVRWQITLYNRLIDKKDVLKKIRMLPMQDGLDIYRQEMNSNYVTQAAEGKSTIEQSKILTVSVSDNNFTNAKKKLSEVETNVNMFLGDIVNQEIVPYTTVERLKLLHSIYNQEEDSEPFYGGEDLFDLDQLAKQGLTTKDVVGPSGFNFKDPKVFQVGETYAQSLFVSTIPSFMTSDFLSAITNVNANMLVSIYYEPTDSAEALKAVRSQLATIEAQVAKHESKMSDDGYSTSFLPPELKKAYEHAQALMDDLLSNDQKVFFLTITITVFGNTKDEVLETAKTVTTIAGGKGATIKPLKNQMEFGLNNSLPLCINELFTERQYTSENASVFIPFTSQELQQRNAIFYGLNSVTGHMILYDRMSGENYNGLIFGKSGTGKSFTAKLEMVSVLLNRSDVQVFVIDPQGEYYPLAQHLRGKVLDISPSTNTYVNPLDLNINMDDDDPVAAKSDFIISLIESMARRNVELSGSAITVIDRCARKIYAPYIESLQERGITCDPKIAPTLADLYGELKRQDDYEADQIAKIMEMYVIGSYNTFAHRTNVDIKNERFIVYNISKLSGGMKELGLLVCNNDIMNRMIENSKKNIWTWFYIDEFHILLKKESTTDFLVRIYKMARKWLGVPTGIMQNTNDLLRSESTKDIFNNTSFILMLSTEEMDRNNLQYLLHLSDEQLKEITNKGKGRGLLYNGRIVIPFTNRFPKETKLYALMTTAHDVKEAEFA